MHNIIPDSANCWPKLNEPVLKTGVPRRRKGQKRNPEGKGWKGDLGGMQALEESKLERHCTVVCPLYSGLPNRRCRVDIYHKE